MTTDAEPTDAQTTVSELRDTMRQFVAERDWRQFHAPKNLAMALAVEVAELMEHFQWIGIEESRQIPANREKLEAVGEELADVVGYALAIANELDLDLSSTIRRKMVKNRLKYPVQEYRGRYGPEDSGPPSERPAPE